MQATMKRLPLLLVLAAAAGCAGTLDYPGSSQYKVADGFAGRRPADVAVLVPAGDLPDGVADALREALQSRLLELRYAPVRSKAMDLAPADFRPGGPNAVLEVVVTKWDDGAMWGDGTLRASAEARLYGAGSKDVLYRAALQDVRVQASFVAHSMEDRPTTVGQAAGELAGVLLARLPAKGD
jgi:hypothetical protein